MAQSSGPISQGTPAERQMTDVLWRDLFGDESGVLGDLDGSAYALTLPSSGDVASVGSTTQRSISKVGGFSHIIPQSSPETITIPAAVGSSRTDIIALQYDPTFTGLPGPVRLARIAGSSSAVPTYDDAPPGAEYLPLWAITRVPGQALNLATVKRMYQRIAPSMELPATSALPLNSPLGTTVIWGDNPYRRKIVGSSPEWVREAYSTGAAPIVSSGRLVTRSDDIEDSFFEATIPDPGYLYRIEANAWVRVFTSAGTRVAVRLRAGAAGGPDSELPILTFSTGRSNPDPGDDVTLPSRMTTSAITGNGRLIGYCQRIEGNGAWDVAPVPSIYYRVVRA